MITARSFQLAQSLSSNSELYLLSAHMHATNSNVPFERWATPVPGSAPSSAYGSFMSVDQLGLDASIFGISLMEL